jgi:hypothetical protein
VFKEEKIMVNSHLKRAALLACIAFFIPVFGLRPVWAEDQSSELKELKRQIEELRSEFHRALAEKQKKIEQLELQVQSLREDTAIGHEAKAVSSAGVPQAQPPVAGVNKEASSEQVQKEIRELNQKVDEVAEAQKKIVPSVFNPSIGFVGETVFSYRSKGSEETGSDRPGGFDVFQRSMELNLAASVDPFARGYAVINASADPVTGDADAEVEEAAIITDSLPWNLTLQAGRFFGEFGRLAYIHDHELPFVNRPLVLDEYIGGESKTDGIQVNYLVPIEHYVSLTVGVGDQFGDIPNDVGNYRHFNELNFWGRASTYFDLTPDISLETGVSGLLNPRAMDRCGANPQPDGSTLTERERRLLGADFVLSYRPLRNNQFKAITWGTELLYSDNRYDVNSSDGDCFSRSVGSYGLYSYLAYKFTRQWTAGFLYEWLEDPLDDNARTYAYSPYLTLALSHWDQLRLQYTHTDHNHDSDLSSDDAFYLQWAWIIGSHAHGWQQR